jgi:predicted  nucleic acid-binding Zn-ribbon protein
MKIQLVTLRCRRCGHRWHPTQKVIRICPKCKSKYWQTRRRTRQGLRPEKPQPKPRRYPTITELNAAWAAKQKKDTP